MAFFNPKLFERSKEPPASFSIQTRDMDILRDVAEYRFLDTAQILALHKGGARNLKRRLALLYQAGYLERPLAQKSFPREKEFMIYSLGEKAEELLFGDEPVQRKKEVVFPYLAHAMMVSRFHTTLTLALREYHTHPTIERWLQSYELHDALTVHGDRPELMPDSFFVIKEGGDSLSFFLEADRGTMTRGIFLEKMKTYWKWWREKRHTENLNIKNFRVLTITNSERRAENLCKITKKADTRQEGSNMFLFLSETQYSLEKKETILSSIWTSPKNEKHGILE